MTTKRPTTTTDPHLGTSKNQPRWLFEVPYGALSIEGRGLTINGLRYS